VIILAQCGPSQNNTWLLMVMYTICWIKNTQFISKYQISSNTRIMTKNSIVFNIGHCIL